ncbi:metal-dependent hydrolase family protein [Vibrio paucivorans]|uniref:Amidohydrolase family protein n=1 Tax=Vibrio paucivorans TaxID=2829489 RepID=A0A9X3CK88_9VIBR|nr:amidohydrolase family protein [Vibrio paucivorans]MCW8336350.1 amidohydrolase family protein [Vibrio paucivorans]
MKKSLLILLLATNSIALNAATNTILIKDVKIFDGKSESLSVIKDVLIKDNLINEIGNIEASSDISVIDGKGQTLMPGLIDTHQHITFVDTPSNLFSSVDAYWIGAVAAKQAEDMLLRGFTTIRDVGGPGIGLARAIDSGKIDGPRIYPSGAMLSQTSGHADMRSYNQSHPNMHGGSQAEMYMGFGVLADGKTEVLRATRENLRMGATQIKAMVGGGGGTPYDPLHTVQYTDKELKAAVQAAADWDTYVMVHGYHDKSVERALNAGVKSIEHGTLLSEKGIKLIKEHDAWLIPQARLFTLYPEDIAFFESLGATSVAKVKTLSRYMERSMALAAEHQLKIGFGTDLFGSDANFAKQNEEFQARTKWFSPYKILQQATYNNAQILEMSGKLNPYKDGKLGVIEKGAYADIIVVNGNPLEDISLLGEPEENLTLIMKNGKIYKNLL